MRISVCRHSSRLFYLPPHPVSSSADRRRPAAPRPRPPPSSPPPAGSVIGSLPYDDSAARVYRHRRRSHHLEDRRRLEHRQPCFDAAASAVHQFRPRARGRRPGLGGGHWRVPARQRPHVGPGAGRRCGRARARSSGMACSTSRRTCRTASPVSTSSKSTARLWRSGPAARCRLSSATTETWAASQKRSACVGEEPRPC